MNDLSKHIVIIAILLFIAKISIADHMREEGSKKSQKTHLTKQKQ